MAHWYDGGAVFDRPHSPCGRQCGQHSPETPSVACGTAGMCQAWWVGQPTSPHCRGGSLQHDDNTKTRQHNCKGSIHGTRCGCGVSGGDTVEAARADNGLCAQPASCGRNTTICIFVNRFLRESSLPECDCPSPPLQEHRLRLESRRGSLACPTLLHCFVCLLCLLSQLFHLVPLVLCSTLVCYPSLLCLGGSTRPDVVALSAAQQLLSSGQCGCRPEQSKVKETQLGECQRRQEFACPPTYMGTARDKLNVRWTLGLLAKLHIVAFVQLQETHRCEQPSKHHIALHCTCAHAVCEHVQPKSHRPPFAC